MKVVLVGEGTAAIQVFQALQERRAPPVAVLTSPPQENKASAGFWKLVAQTGLEPWPGKWVKDPGLAERLRALQPDILLNLYSLFMIHADNLSVARLGSYNVHPGPLPKYAGLNSMCWAIYRGETQHGVTVHEMVPEVDAGPIVFQESFDIAEQDTGLRVSTKCIRVAVELALRLLDVAQNAAKIPVRPQEHGQREYFASGPPQGGWVSWAEPAKKVFDFVRACDFAPLPSPWGHPKTRIGEQEIQVLKASRTGKPCNRIPGSVGAETEAGVEVATQDEWLLVRQIAHSGKAHPARSFLKTHDQLAEP